MLSGALREKPHWPQTGPASVGEPQLAQSRAGATSAGGRSGGLLVTRFPGPGSSPDDGSDGPSVIPHVLQ